MKKYVILLLVGIFSLISVAAFAQTDASAASPGILPSSPFYFLKEWRRGIAKTFAFSAEKKAELEFKEVEERAAEIKKLEEVSPEKTEALTRAVENYQENIERLKTRLENLKDTSNNPNIEELISRVVDRSVEHQELFDSLRDKLPEQEKMREQLQISREKIEEVISGIPEQLKNSEIIREKLQLRELNQLREINQTAPSSGTATPPAVREKIMEQEVPAGLSPLKNINEYLQEKKEEIQERKREQSCIQVITPAVSPDGTCKEFPTPCDVPADWKAVESCPSVSETSDTATSSPVQSVSPSISY